MPSTTLTPSRSQQWVAPPCPFSSSVIGACHLHLPYKACLLVPAFPPDSPFFSVPTGLWWGYLSPTGTSQVSPTLPPTASVSPSNRSNNRAHIVVYSFEGIFLIGSSRHPASSSSRSPSTQTASKKCYRPHRCRCGCGPQPFNLNRSYSELLANLRPPKVKLNVPSHRTHASAPHALGLPHSAHSPRPHSAQVPAGSRGKVSRFHL